MPIEHAALLKTQRDLHDIPRGMERFQAYLKAIINDEGDDVRYMPMVAMNPMGREHVAERLDELLALDADAAAAEAIAEALSRLGDVPDVLQHGLVIVDDVRGGWTNRTNYDFWGRFGLEMPLKRPWLMTGLWVSEAPSLQHICQSVLLTVFRLKYIQQHGQPKTLREMLVQEGAAGAFAGLQPRHDAEEIAYTREALAPCMDSTDYAVQIAALYGNQAARMLGYEPLGVSEHAAFDMALADTIAQS